MEWEYLDVCSRSDRKCREWLKLGLYRSPKRDYPFLDRGGDSQCLILNQSLSMVRSTTSQATTTNLNVSNIASTSVLTVSNTLNLPAGSVTNAYLQNSSLTVTAGNGLTGGGAISLGGSASIDLGVDSTLSVSANSVGLNLANANTWTALQTFSSGILSGASSTLVNLTMVNSTTTNATTSNSGSLIRLDVIRFSALSDGCQRQDHL